MEAMFADTFRQLFLFIADGVGLALVIAALSARRRESLGVTFLVGLVVAGAAAVIAIHYGSLLSTAPPDAFVLKLAAKLAWSIVTAVISLIAIVISLVRMRKIAPDDP